MATRLQGLNEKEQEMISSKLKIARDVKELLWMVMELRKDMDKHLRFGIVNEMQETINKMFDRISYANRFKEPKVRIGYLTALLAEYGKLELYVEFCVEHKLIKGQGKCAKILSLVYDIGKQATGWKNSVEKELSK